MNSEQKDECRDCLARAALRTRARNCHRFESLEEAKAAYWREVGDPADWRKLGDWMFAEISTLAVEARPNREAAVGAHPKAAESSAGMGRVGYDYTMQNCVELSRGRTRRGESPGACGRHVHANRPIILNAGQRQGAGQSCVQRPAGGARNSASSLEGDGCAK